MIQGGEDTLVIKRIILSAPSSAGIVAALVSILTIAHADTSGVPPCPRGAPQCPIAITLKAKATPLVLRGRLSPRHSSYSYQFSATPGYSLGWTYVGPAVNVLLSNPDGETDGPGLPGEVPLEKNGVYVFSISSNKMAENIYGEFSLSFRLKKQK
jgi:hypothetical protein